MKSPWGEGGGVLFNMLGPSAVGQDGTRAMVCAPKRTWMIVDAVQLAGDTALAGLYERLRVRCRIKVLENEMKTSERRIVLVAKELFFSKL